jgi:hypothetical protein
MAMGDCCRCECGAVWEMLSDQTAFLCPACGGTAATMDPGSAADQSRVLAVLSAALGGVPMSVILGDSEILAEDDVAPWLRHLVPRLRELMRLQVTIAAEILAARGQAGGEEGPPRN